MAQGRSHEEDICGPRGSGYSTAAYFPLVLIDNSGGRHQGQLVVAHRWRPELLEAEASNEFSIILAMREIRAQIPASLPPNIALCLPRKLPLGPSAISDSPSLYLSDPTASPEWEAPAGLPFLDAQAREAFAQGSIVMAGPSDIASEDIFPPDWRTPRWHLLAQRLLRASMSGPLAHIYWQAAAAALAAPDEPTLSEPAAILEGLRQAIETAKEALTSFTGPAAEHLGERLSTLHSLVRVKTLNDFLNLAQQYYPLPASLAEEVLMCRALAIEPRATLELSTMRHYLRKAEIPSTHKDLAWQRTLAWEQTSFSVVLMELHRLPAIRADFDRFRHFYHAAYREHHRLYHKKTRALREALESFRAHVEGLQRLNGLQELGPPLGQDALEEYHQLLAATVICNNEARLTEGLAEGPLCPSCSITLVSQPPEDLSRQVLDRVQRALEQQLRRLSGEAVRRILAESKEGGLEKFLQAVVASDTAGLVNVLDDEIANFLRGLLTIRPSMPTAVPLQPVLERLQQKFPEVERADVEAVVQELRWLLQEATR